MKDTDTVIVMPEGTSTDPAELRKHVEDALAKRGATGNSLLAQTPTKPVSDALRVANEAKTRIVDLEKLWPYRDLIAVMGFVMIITAIARFDTWIALGAAGVCLIVLSYLLSGE
jgi:hypothetical protein